MSDLFDGVSAAAPSPDDGGDPPSAFPPRAGASLGLPGIDDEPIGDGGGSQGTSAGSAGAPTAPQAAPSSEPPVDFSDWLRNSVEDRRGVVYGDVLPVAVDPKAHAWYFTMPEVARDWVRGLADLTDARQYDQYLAQGHLPQEAIGTLMTPPLAGRSVVPRGAPAEIAPEVPGPQTDSLPERAGSLMPEAPPDPPTPTKIRATGEGEAEEESAPPAPFHDRLDDFKAFRDDKGYGDDPLSQNYAARDYVMQRQGDTKAEHVVGYDADANAITHAGTSLREGEAGLPGDLVDALDDPTQHINVHHSHPDSTGLSRDDIGIAGMRGARWVAAHGINGELSAARMTAETRSALADRMAADPDGAVNVLEKLAGDAADESWEPMEQAIDRGEFTEEEGRRIWVEARNRALARNGLIDYVTTHALPDSPVVKEMQERANSSVQAGINESFPASTVHASDQLPVPVRPGDGMDRISRPDDEAAPGRYNRALGGRNRAPHSGEITRSGPQSPESSNRQTEGAGQRSSLRRANEGAAVESLGHGFAGDRTAPRRYANGSILEKGGLSPHRFSRGGGEDAADGRGNGPVHIRGDELGRKPESYGKLQMLAARYARERLDGSSVTNQQTGLPITLAWPRTLRRETLPGTPPALLLAIPALPALLAQGRYAGSAPDPRQRPAVKAVHYFRSDADVAGTPLALRLAVRQHHAGKYFFDGVEGQDGPRRGGSAR